MPAFSTKKVEKSLKKKGFTKSNGDHRYFEFYHNGKAVLFTKTSHSSPDVNDCLISLMAKQCKLSKSEFKDLINCPLSQADYIKILEEKEIL